MNMHDRTTGVVMEQVLAPGGRPSQHLPVDPDAAVANRPCGLETATGDPAKRR